MTTAARTADAILAAANVHPAGEGLAGRDRLIAFLGAQIVESEAETRRLQAIERRARRIRLACALAFSATITAAVLLVLP